MYRPRGTVPSLEELLARVKGKKPPVPAHVKKPYSTSDIAAARAVLDRLLSLPARSEVSSHKEVPTQNNEDRL